MALPATMDVATYYRNDDVRIERMPLPHIGPGEMLLQVRASGICGSDVMEWYRAPKAPLVLGHEVSGTVDAIGAGVEHFAVGDRVMATHHVPCLRCHHCLRGHQSVCDELRTTTFEPGGFAQYIRLPAANVERGTLALPPQVDFDSATFIEPLGCVVRGLRLARWAVGDSVLVMGSGITGLLNLLALHAQGAGTVVLTDLVDYRLRMARSLGATAAVRADGDVAAALRSANEGRLADLVIVCTGAPRALEGALDLVERGGTILYFAPAEPAYRLSLPFTRLWKDEVNLTTSYAASPGDLRIALALLANGRVDVRQMITHRLPLQQAAQGFSLVAAASESMKVILHPSG